MRDLQEVHEFEKIKLLADPRRLLILRLLMASPATLTQLAHRLRQSPAWVRHHLKLLQSASMVDLVEVRRVGRQTEKYYAARAAALRLQELILPKTRLPAIVFSGSHDLALQEIGRRLESQLLLLTGFVGSLDGLMNLRQGLCHFSGAHLRGEGGEFNVPFVRSIFADREVEMVTLAHRTQGLMLAPGNPKSIRAVSDLSRRGVRFVNRNAGSGTRLWLEAELRRTGQPQASILGFQHAVKTHTEVAALIHAGKADAGLGLEAAADAAGVGFLPLFEERYDLVLPRDSETLLTPVLDYVQTSRFRTTVNLMRGYETSHTGDVISVQRGA